MAKKVARKVTQKQIFYFAAPSKIPKIRFLGLPVVWPKYAFHPLFCFLRFLQGVAGGTFLYVTFFEVLPSELGSHSRRGGDYSRMLKFLFVVAGYSCICGILFFTH